MKESSFQIYKSMPHGFHLHSADFSRANVYNLLHSADEWEVLAGILLSCQSGCFDPLDRIPELLRKQDSFMFWMCATQLLGYAGSWRLIKQFFESYTNKLDDRGVQYFLPIVLASSCGIWAVEPLLEIHAKAVEEEPRYQIQRHLSYLLEAENELIWAGANEKSIMVDSEELNFRRLIDFEGYEKEVRAIRDTVLQSVGSMNAPVYEGQELDVARLAKTLYERLASRDNSKDRIYREKMLFEATTGINCSAFFDKDNVLQYLPATAIMEMFLESNRFNCFEPGQRYFFGHFIPSEV